MIILRRTFGLGGALVLLWLSAAAEAKCAHGRLSVWPDVKERLPANARVVLEGYGADEVPVSTIAEQKPALVSGDEQVPLLLDSTYEGFRVTEAVLRPAHSLRPGRRYGLQLLAPKVAEPMALTSMAWDVGEPDRSPPRWRKAPRAAGGWYQHAGCGPSIAALIKIDVDDNGHPVAFLVEIRDTNKTHPQKRYLVSAFDDKLDVGYGMCSGPFELTPGKHCRVKLTAVDAAGNAAEAPGPPVEIVGPAPRRVSGK